MPVGSSLCRVALRVVTFNLLEAREARVPAERSADPLLVPAAQAVVRSTTLRSSRSRWLSCSLVLSESLTKAKALLADQVHAKPASRTKSSSRSSLLAATQSFLNTRMGLMTSPVCMAWMASSSLSNENCCETRSIGKWPCLCKSARKGRNAGGFESPSHRPM